MKKKTIAIDLDGVIHAYSEGWNGGAMYDIPVKESHEALTNLVARGFRIAIVTARLNPKFPDMDKQRKAVETWLLENKFIEGEHYHELTNNKPAAIAYIDDRAIAFENWEQAVSDLQNLIP
ncbi:MAG: hypothetical protein WD200_04860 [Candidatus Andersenbacteria bacterium]